MLTTVNSATTVPNSSTIVLPQWPSATLVQQLAGDLQPGISAVAPGPAVYPIHPPVAPGPLAREELYRRINLRFLLQMEADLRHWVVLYGFRNAPW